MQKECNYANNKATCADCTIPHCKRLIKALTDTQGCTAPVCTDRAHPQYCKPLCLNCEKCARTDTEIVYGIYHEADKRWLSDINLLCTAWAPEPNSAMLFVHTEHVQECYTKYKQALYGTVIKQIRIFTDDFYEKEV